MRTTDDLLRTVVAAAEAVLEAREDQMLTSEEWDALKHAIAACHEPPPDQREESFSIDQDGGLVRSVTPKRGNPYEHRCTRWAFERVYWRFDEHGEGDTVETLAEAAQIPVTQAATALAFLLERGIVTAERRRNFPATADVHLDAMTEYHALREAPGD
ncbi:MAG: hypothetical protein K8E66_11510 [Phycisphaerales bacterium]|nr:hypothetical protein [Phycisphaerales bacterium]